MREILFRGKRIDINEWIEGYYAVSPTDSKSYIYAKDYTEVDIAEDGLHVAYRLMQVIPETIGQYTGLTDKNGKKIFEGDVVHVNYTLLYRKSSSVIVQEKIIDYKAKVMFSKGRFHLKVHLKVFDGIEYELSEDSSVREVIGNIHDNPELLEVKE